MKLLIVVPKRTALCKNYHEIHPNRCLHDIFNPRILLGIASDIEKEWRSETNLTEVCCRYCCWSRCKSKSCCELPRNRTASHHSHTPAKVFPRQRDLYETHLTHQCPFITTHHPSTQGKFTMPPPPEENKQASANTAVNILQEISEILVSLQPPPPPIQANQCLPSPWLKSALTQLNAS